MHRRSGRCLFAARAGASGDDLPLREEAAMQAAVARVTPSVVSIDKVGGLEPVGQGALRHRAPTTGLIVISQIRPATSSSSALISPEAASILVELADGSRARGATLATDRNRILSSLAAQDFGLRRVCRCPKAYAKRQMRVGQIASTRAAAL